MSIQLPAARAAALGLLVLALAGCQDMGMGGTTAVGNPSAVGDPVGTAEVDCDRPNEPTGQIVETPSGGTTAVVDTGVGATSPTAPNC